MVDGRKQRGSVDTHWYVARERCFPRTDLSTRASKKKRPNGRLIAYKGMCKR